MKYKKAYYTVTPSHLLEDIRLTSTARVVYGIVENLTHKTGVCFASNDYILGALGFCGERTLQRALALLEECGYIKRDIITDRGNQNERKITLSDDWKMVQKPQGGGDKNDTGVVTKMSSLYNNDEKQSNKKYILTTRARVDELFEKLWDVYPKTRRGSKQKAYDSFVHLVCADRIDPEQILAKIPEYVNSSEVADKGMVQYLYRWLENRGYEAEYKPATKKKAEPEENMPITMPAIGVKGCEIWTEHNLRFRNKNHLWSSMLRRTMDDYYRMSPADYIILRNIQIAGNMGEEIAKVIYFLGNGGDIKALEQAFVHQWWRQNAYLALHKGTSTLEEKRAEWQELCKEIGMTEYIDHNPTDDFKRMDEFYKRMGWK